MLTMHNPTECTYDEYLDIEHAKRIKEMGFDLMTYAHYYLGKNEKYALYFEHLARWNNAYGVDAHRYCAAPTYSQMQAWLRQKYGLHISVELQICEKFVGYIGKIYKINRGNFVEDGSSFFCSKPEDVALKRETEFYDKPDDALKKCVEICLDYLYKPHDK